MVIITLIWRDNPDTRKGFKKYQVICLKVSPFTEKPATTRPIALGFYETPKGRLAVG